MESFKDVLGQGLTCGKLTGQDQAYAANYLFATVQTLSKDDHLFTFDPSEFDYIIVDESHRSGATTYQKILNYFKPAFLLGMTATPERSDDHNIAADFDYNIAYEIRLQEAMEENMLCPFHYFGVTDISIDGQVIDDSSDFTDLTADMRTKNVIDQIKRYGHDGPRVRGLIFCSRNSEAAALSECFNAYGYKTVALSDNRSFNKDTIRRYTTEGTRLIPGASTINFDAIARRKIYQAIDQVNFNSIQVIKESYTNLKYRCLIRWISSGDR